MDDWSKILFLVAVLMLATFGILFLFFYIQGYTLQKADVLSTQCTQLGFEWDKEKGECYKSANLLRCDVIETDYNTCYPKRLGLIPEPKQQPQADYLTGTDGNKYSALIKPVSQDWLIKYCENGDCNYLKKKTVEDISEGHWECVEPDRTSECLKQDFSDCKDGIGDFCSAPCIEYSTCKTYIWAKEQ